MKVSEIKEIIKNLEDQTEINFYLIPSDGSELDDDREDKILFNPQVISDGSDSEEPYIDFGVQLERPNGEHIRTKERFARKCDITGKGINDGYFFDSNCFYIGSQEDAKKYVESLGYNWEEELKTVNTKNEWFYWTEWEVENECFYDADGLQYEIK